YGENPLREAMPEAVETNQPGRALGEGSSRDLAIRQVPEHSVGQNKPTGPAIRGGFPGKSPVGSSGDEVSGGKYALLHTGQLSNEKAENASKLMLQRLAPINRPAMPAKESDLLEQFTRNLTLLPTNRGDVIHPGAGGGPDKPAAVLEMKEEKSRTAHKKFSLALSIAPDVSA